MAGLSKIENYLMALGVSFEEIGQNTWLIEDPGKGLPKLIISWADPVVVVRANVMTSPTREREAFFAKLLQLNAEQLLHGAYALEGDKVILVDTLEYETMDKTEFEASIDAIGFALSEHYPLLSRFLAN